MPWTPGQAALPNTGLTAEVTPGFTPLVPPVLPASGTEVPEQISTFDTTLAGAVNGSNKTFTSPFTPVTQMLFRNGLLMTMPADYSSAGDAVTFVPLQTPVTGDVITARTYDPTVETAALPYNIPQQFSTNDGSLSGLVNGANQTFAIVTNCLVTELLFFWNGDMMTNNVDYVWSCVQYSSAGPWVSQITMIAGQVPNAGDVLTAEVFSQ